MYLVRSNPVKKRLIDGDVVLGLMVTEFRTPWLGAMLSAANIDFAIIDMEHGAYNYETVADMILGCLASDVTPFVRVPEIRKECFTKVLDAGAQGILVPGVERRDQAELAVRYAKYAPTGERGVSLRKPHTGFAPPGRVEYTRFANEQTMVMIQVETATALHNMDQLAQVDGVDLVFIGPADLVHSLSPTEDTGEQSLIDDAVQQILNVCTKNTRRVGIHMADPKRARDLIQRGVQLLTIGTDVSMLIDAGHEKVLQMRRLLEAGNAS